MNLNEAMQELEALGSEQTRKTWHRHGALIGLGGSSAATRKAAEQVVRRIEPVAFDPGNTACEFPDALPYFAKVWERKKGR